MRSESHRILFLAASTLLFGCLASVAPVFAAVTEKVLYSFCSVSGCTDGSESTAGLVLDLAGNLYSTTVEGGANGHGTVFQLAPRGDGAWTQTVLYSFCSASNCIDGAYPFYGSLILDAAGNLYGTTSAGGTDCAGGCGTVFELTPPATPCISGSCPWKETVLHTFIGGDDGLFA